MFFRREKPKIQTFAERIALLRNAGFETQNLTDGEVKIAKHGVAAVVKNTSDNHAGIERAGIEMAGELAVPVSRGYQLFLETPSGKKFPAMAEQLKALHQFEDDVKDALHVTNLYNTSLGTTSLKHQYDRVSKPGHEARPWDKKTTSI